MCVRRRNVCVCVRDRFTGGGGGGNHILYDNYILHEIKVIEGFSLYCEIHERGTRDYQRLFSI